MAKSQKKLKLHLSNAQKQLNAATKKGDFVLTEHLTNEISWIKNQQLISRSKSLGYHSPHYRVSRKK